MIFFGLCSSLLYSSSFPLSRNIILCSLLTIIQTHLCTINTNHKTFRKCLHHYIYSSIASQVSVPKDSSSSVEIRANIRSAVAGNPKGLTSISKLNVTATITRTSGLRGRNDRDVCFTSQSSKFLQQLL